MVRETRGDLQGPYILQLYDPGYDWLYREEALPPPFRPTSVGPFVQRTPDTHQIDMLSE